MRLAMFNARRSGKTTAICKAAKEIDATVITHSEQEAQRLRETYGVKAISVTVQETFRTGRHDEPFIWDAFAADSYIDHLWDLIADKNKLIRRYKRKLGVEGDDE